MRDVGSQKPRALVTGAAGFLGSHLCERLLAEGYEVIGLDNLVTGNLDNLAHLRNEPTFTFVEHDVSEPLTAQGRTAGFTPVLAHGPSPGNRLNYILHFASPASPPDYLRHPILTLRAGSFGTYQMMELAKAHQSTILIASSSEVYGDPEITPQVESYWGNVNPIGPRSVYDEAKRFSEAITVAYHRAHNVSTRIARIFNTYGERMRMEDGRVLPNFISQSLQGQPLTIYGDGSQTRSFCYVSDTVEGLYRLLLSDENEPVNIGNPDEVTILQFAREVIELTGSASRMEFRALPSDDPKRRKPDISRAITKLGWRPEVSRREGIQRVIPYFKEQLEKTIPSDAA